MDLDERDWGPTMSQPTRPMPEVVYKIDIFLNFVDKASRDRVLSHVRTDELDLLYKPYPLRL
jgi:hypothetical protein